MTWVECGYGTRVPILQYTFALVNVWWRSKHMTGTGVDNIDFMMFMKMMVTCHPGKHCNAVEVGEEPHHHADYL